MISATIEFANVLFAALLVGSMFGVWLVFNPAGVSASDYVTLQQQAIRGLNKSMPMLGAATILLTIAAAIVGQAGGMQLRLLVAAAVCFAAAGVITRFLNQPINAIVMTWSSGAVPADWMGLRDAWWRWHVVRLAAGIGGLSLLIVATIRRA